MSISPITDPRCPEGSRKLRFLDYVTMAKQSPYRPEVPRGFQEVKVPRLRGNGKAVPLQARGAQRVPER